MNFKFVLFSQFWTRIMFFSVGYFLGILFWFFDSAQLTAFRVLLSLEACCNLSRDRLLGVVEEPRFTHLLVVSWVMKADWLWWSRTWTALRSFSQTVHSVWHYKSQRRRSIAGNNPFRQYRTSDCDYHFCFISGVCADLYFFNEFGPVQNGRATLTRFNSNVFF